MEWKQRAKRDVTAVSKRRHWESYCGKYRVTESASLLHHTIKVRGKPRVVPLPTVWYAQVWDGCWDIISRHRQKERAFAAVEQFAKRHA